MSCNKPVGALLAAPVENATPYSLLPTPAPLTVLSWGVGVQSTAMAAMVALGDLPPVDIVIHIDTGWERKPTIASRDW